ncbi:G-protein coupled receptor family C group 6 member A-like [Anarrhichthys ocellatus]|uniref:G-protein coupled receptor family C group 6 member A-like n=1 Tax=Anarrhichthys ocellatus TaxID=433405 RepID=UPI0012ED10CE|nr:G-protein coupled receptor family C group 6 member A-like [Anarrhichthys ocellatus]
MAVFCPCLVENVSLHAYSPGDIIIGGVFPIHGEINRSTVSGQLSCSGYDIQKFLRTQVMIHAIREINQRTPRVLPNFTIGYDIYDTCGDISLAIRATLQLLRRQSEPQSCLVPTRFHSALTEPETKAVIGEYSSEGSIAVARVVALSSVTQIGYAATCQLLSRKLKFPTFLRTIPSDEHQTKAIAKLVSKFNWKSVAIVASDDMYGKYGSENLEDLLSKMKDICNEFIFVLPGNFSHNNSHNHTCLADLMSKINKSSAEAVILFTKESNAAVIMEAAIERSLNRTWIATDTWSTSMKVSALPGIEMAGEVFGFVSKRNEVPDFKDYVISMFNGTTNGLLEDYLAHFPLCFDQSEENGESNCSLTNNQTAKQCLDPSSLANYIDQDISYNIYLAVQVIAEGLRSLLKCDNHHCEHSTEFTAQELFMEIKNVNFTVNKTHIFFDSNGDPGLGYDILYWNKTESKQHTQIETIGEYLPSGQVKVPDDLVRNMCSVMVSAYNCSKTCKRGQELKMQNKSCCNYCIPCADAEFSAGKGEECKRCGAKQYSSPQRERCLEKTVQFLHWAEPFVIVLSALGVFGITVTIVFAVLFTVYRGTPVVKAVGGYLCLLELFSLLACFCLSFSFAGKPTDGSCMVGLPLFGIAFSLCISCILANLLQILVGFSFQLNKRSRAKRLHQPAAVVTIVTGIQLALCVPWLCLYPPHANDEIFRESILKQCEKGSYKFFIAMLAYNAFLALICFLFAFKGKQLPDLYKNASLISISMLLFLIVWVFFIPIYISLIGRYKSAIESTAILISSYSILGCHLAPKCYIMVFRKELNNESAITEYIRKHYEQKGVSVVTS